jgi:branched-chain amino acid transport system ATP-binding protein
MAEILRTQSLTKLFGGVAAVLSVDITVYKGTTHAVIGPNGAGKSTLFNLITSYLAPTRGGVFFKGKEITNQPPHKICRMGIARSFQLTNIYPKLTSFESVQMSLLSLKGLAGKVFKSSSSLLRKETENILEMVGLADKKDSLADVLSHGDKKRLELGITLGNKPVLLLMDEPTAGMGRDETWAIVDLIQRLRKEEGLTILFTEHDMDVVFEIADRISVLHQGIVICEGTPQQVQQDDSVRACYLGTAAYSTF